MKVGEEGCDGMGGDARGGAEGAGAGAGAEVAFWVWDHQW